MMRYHNAADGEKGQGKNAIISGSETNGMAMAENAMRLNLVGWGQWMPCMAGAERPNRGQIGSLPTPTPNHDSWTQQTTSHDRRWAFWLNRIILVLFLYSHSIF
jgi:hypothetical protein